jgi:hypothetical protein
MAFSDISIQVICGTVSKIDTVSKPELI